MPSSKPVVRDGFIALSEPVLGGNEWTYVKDCLDTGWVSSVGEYVNKFEQALANCVRARYAVATTNGTSALHVSLLAVGVKPGDAVIVPAITFVAPISAVRYCQADPIFIDVDPATWQIDPVKVERFLAEECERRADGCYHTRTGRRVRALLAVHLLGGACEIERLAACAKAWQLQLVEDAAEAIGVRYKGRHVGSWGEAGAFSFNGNKVVTCGGGGMIVTNDERIANYCRYLTTQAKDDPLEYFHQEVGYNYRLTNVQAAIGLAQLEQLDGFLIRKRAIAEAYARGLADIPGLAFMQIAKDCDPAYWLWTFLLPDTTTLAERKLVIKQLNAAGIGARPLWHPIHRLPPYRDCLAYQIDHAIRLYERAVSLPSGAGLTDEQVDRCIEEVRRCVSGLLRT